VSRSARPPSACDFLATRAARHGPRLEPGRTHSPPYFHGASLSTISDSRDPCSTSRAARAPGRQPRGTLDEIAGPRRCHADPRYDALLPVEDGALRCGGAAAAPAARRRLPVRSCSCMLATRPRSYRSARPAPPACPCGALGRTRIRSRVGLFPSREYPGSPPSLRGGPTTLDVLVS